MLPNLDALLECSILAARAAGDHALSNYNRRHEVAERFAHDIKLRLDSESQRKAEEVIRHRFPDHGILGEESVTQGVPAGSEPLWIIDPIDGTVNFKHGLPLWCSAVAVQVDGCVVAGAVILPEMKECYTASLESPALCNDKPIHVSDTASMGESLILTGLSKNMTLHPYTAQVVEAISHQVQKVRIMGSAAVDICHVACGKAEGYVETGIYLWDIAAAGLIAGRAGAKTEVLEKLGDIRLRYLCTNGLIHEPLKKTVMDTIRQYAPRP